MSLTKLEVRILKEINKIRHKSKAIVKNYLTKTLLLPLPMVNKYYMLWFLNYREDGKYEEITEVNRDLKPIVTLLHKISSNELDPDDIPEIYFGPELEYCTTSGGYYSSGVSNAPCIELDTHEVIIHLDRDSMNSSVGVTGLHQEDLWKYYEAFHGSDHYEEFDEEEFNYVHFDDETLTLTKQIALMANKNDIISYLDGDDVKSEDLQEIFKTLLPKDKYDSMVQDYLYVIGYMTTSERGKATREYYESEIKYPVNDGSFTIPMDEFIESLEDESVLSFPDIITDEIELQPEVDLDDGYHDAGYWDSDSKDHIIELNRHLKGVVEEFGGEEGSLLDFYEKMAYIEKVFKETGLEKTSTNWRNLDTYKSKDGRLIVTSDGINLYNEKIRFTYDGEKHTVPLKNFVNWAQGSVLDLKYETVRYGKLPLMESKKEITKIAIFDFDGTLADTPDREDGIPLWEVKTGEEYPHKGWYSKRESLDSEVFNIKLIESTIRDYMVESKDPNTKVIMLTGRMSNQADQIEELLSKNGVVFEEYHYKERGDTFTSKINSIKKIVDQNPNVTLVEMWEDRLNHADGFEDWGSNNDVNLNVNRINL